MRPLRSRWRRRSATVSWRSSASGIRAKNSMPARPDKCSSARRAPASYCVNIVIAYEPVWSIGEGGTPAEPSFANRQHEHIKRVARGICGQDVPVLYGGSVNLANCQALITEPEIDGLFIGRAAWQ